MNYSLKENFQEMTAEEKAEENRLWWKGFWMGFFGVLFLFKLKDYFTK